MSFASSARWKKPSLVGPRAWPGTGFGPDRRLIPYTVPDIIENVIQFLLFNIYADKKKNLIGKQNQKIKTQVSQIKEAKCPHSTFFYRRAESVKKPLSIPVVEGWMLRFVNNVFCVPRISQK